jgi:predicted negative regulator of RcsB-dependent stress response
MNKEESTVSIEDVADSINAVMEASREYEEAFAAYDGYEWGYHGWRETEKKDKALKQLQSRLDSYVDSRIKELLKIALEEKA